ncbi:group I truncated hemoglobin [Kordiimonas gwangyangensis]|uniref:group I truncated hemoglobin n=1 Tax=Kordiimonas gwangyangensis TaxID=288022 RepID=UPI000374060E|nr:group 1 truncated hemoglobin [Kordiimonas gwangyangensis]
MKVFKHLVLAGMIAATPAATTQTAMADSLFEDLGGMTKIERITSRLLDLTFTDPRTAPQFKQTKRDRLEKLLNDQFCELTGGPCKYKGVNMKKSHIKLGITEREFNAMVEQLQAAMDAEDVPYHTQNRFLALLAPMKRDIVER